MRWIRQGSLRDQQLVEAEIAGIGESILQIGEDPGFELALVRIIRHST
jgi:hypothetical protein